MLELSKVKKNYLAGENTVHALKGVSLQFRSHEFVSILGPSGCGKTTMLNIIGGLDKYTEGDLVINGTSTRDFSDKDWDAYRNHSVGFVFQSYNLIPHQTVLQNVEMALTLSGVSQKERKQRAIEALQRVGLGDQLKKKPREMSGGQMQRVAIARAIVNNPDIILADEPTGALDTETSVQVMEILKEISEDRLVVMVTHNPELAEQYSTRIVRMLDGEILSDTKPLSRKEFHAEMTEARRKRDENAKKKHPSMKLSTSFGLSLKNLFTKKGRTVLTSFAGSIGIIGIALIYAVSDGTTKYIDSVQEQTLSSYPITLEAKTVDMTSFLSLFMGKAESISEHEADGVYQKAMLYEMINAMNSMEETENDLVSFKKYIEEKNAEEDSEVAEAIEAIQYGYNVDLLVYTENVDGTIIESDLQQLMVDLMLRYLGADFSQMISMNENSIMGSASSARRSNMSLWKELLVGENGAKISEVTKNQYDLIYGDWPSEYNEIVLFVDDNQEIDDLTLYAMGLKSEEEMAELSEASANKKTIEYEVKKWTYEELCNMDFRTILNSDCYIYDEKTGTYSDLRDTETGLKYLYDNALKLKVSGIVKPADDSISSSQGGSIGYTHALTEYIIEKAHDSEAVKAQKEDTTKDIFTGLPFKEANEEMTTAEKADKFKKYINELDEKEKAATYVEIASIPSEQLIESTVKQYMTGMTRKDMETSMIQALSSQMSMDTATITAYLESMSDEDITAYFRKSIEEQVKAQYAAEIQQNLAMMSVSELAAALKKAVKGYTDRECADYYETILDFSNSTYDSNLIKLGCVELDAPSTINLYASTFEGKDVIEDAIKEYNDSVEDIKQIQYTDYVGLIMSSVTTIINAITYVLIAFVAVSLIVSSIMIGVITLISVQERTKEIGILRALGASKKNVSSMFNAETLLIGFASGILGVGVTYILCIPINIILHNLSGINSLNANLPIVAAVVLILISMFLTLIAGIIPSRSAAKKDPVVALRTE